VDLASRRYCTQRLTNLQFVRRSLRPRPRQKVHSSHVDTTITPETSDYPVKVASMLLSAVRLRRRNRQDVGDGDEIKLRPLEPAARPFQQHLALSQLRESFANPHQINLAAEISRDL